jgi:hypothetical protein
MQYDFAASLLPSYDNIEELILPYLILDRSTFQFISSPEKDEWTDPAAFKSFEAGTYLTKTHPILNKTFEDMNPAEKTQDGECRALSSLFLEDLHRSRTLATEDLLKDFGFFNEKKRQRK